MQVGESRLGKYLVLHPIGRLDDGTSAEFQARLVAALTNTTADIIIDFAAVGFVSSSGLRALISATRAKPPGRRMAVVAINTVVQEVFTISRLHDVIPLAASVAEVAAAWDSARPAPSLTGWEFTTTTIG